MSNWIFPQNLGEHFDQEYGKECLDELKADKNFPLKVTPYQAITILEPIHAPENYHHDGEVTEEEALDCWKQKLKNSGLNPTHIECCRKYIFG